MSLDETGPFDAGTETVVTLSVDNGEDISTCTARVVVVDDEAPEVDCGSVGVIAPCEAPIDVAFGAATKTNGCPVTVTALHEECVFCNRAVKRITRDCDVSVSGGVATIHEAGGVKSHIIFSVTATNDVGSLSDVKSCTICTQNPSADFEPGCSGGIFDNDNQYECPAGFPDASFECSRSLLRLGH